MRYKTHIAGGIGLGLLAINSVGKIPGIIDVNVADEKSIMIVVGGLALGSLIPDIDHRNSYISNRLKITSGVLSRMFNHRGFTHSILGAFTITSVFVILMSSFANISVETIKLFSLALLLGIFSHILLDMLTPSGVELLNPITSKRFRIYSHLIRVPEFVYFLLLSYLSYRGLGFI